jgi:Ca2+/Na+ antiporter
LTGAIMIITYIVYHQRIYWYHSIILICYYLCYVLAVVLGAYSNNDGNKNLDIQQKTELLSSKDDMDEATYLLYQGGMC